MNFSKVSLVICIFVLQGCASQAPQESKISGNSPDRLGNVHFETTCSSAVQDDFNRATALLHSFWFNAAIDAYQDVAARDPQCAMAHWGIAMSWWGNPFGGFRPATSIANGAAAVEAARAANPKSARERAYIEAVALLYKDAAMVNQRTRTLAYEQAMQALAEAYPEDSEARIYYALSLDQTHEASDKTYKNLLAAAEILEQEFEKQPDHPGVAHYLIHSYDVPLLAERGVDAARRYAGIAPDAPHALHMPSHTFTRIGAWQESIETNQASAVAARKDNGASEELHALDYQVYAYLQTGQDAAARKVLEEAPEIAKRINSSSAGNAAPSPAGYFALAAMEARYALERNDWAAAARLQARQTPFGWVDSTTHFARALGAARIGDVAAAQMEAAKLAELHRQLESANNSYWAWQVAIQHMGASAAIAYAEGRIDEGLAMMREAAQMEDVTEKSAITPGPLKPARELLGEMLLEQGQAAAALAEFEETMKSEPNRFRTVYGAAVAAEQSGDKAKAQQYFRDLLTITERADAGARVELAQARDSVGD